VAIGGRAGGPGAPPARRIITFPLGHPQGCPRLGGHAPRIPPEQPPTGVVRLLRHQPALDGLRGGAWLLVFVGHAELIPNIALGPMAMFVFFALSGFLITGLVVTERSATGAVSLGRFFARRALRLLPALVVFLLIWLVVVAVFGRQPWIGTVPGSGSGKPESLALAVEGVVAAVTYTTNWSGILGFFTGYIPLGHLWSLAVEEQIYVVWAPLLVVLLAWRHRAALVAAAGLGVLTFVDVLTHLHGGQGGDRVYMGTDTRAGAFLLGGAIALAWSRGDLSFLRRRWIGGTVTCLALLTLALTTVGLEGRQTSDTYFAAWTAASVAAAALVAALVVRRGAGTDRILSGEVIGYLGRRSYALYLWHYVWLTWFRDLGRVGVLLALAATLASAEASWRLVEVRFLRYRRRLAARVDPPPREPEPEREVLINA
jgi:peptidoglycan/LPS O-acetylase OafA/YrhL